MTWLTSLSRLALVGVTLSTASALAEPVPGVVSLPFEKRTVSGDDQFLRRLRKRESGYVPGTIDVQDDATLYLMKMTIGTPPQSLSILLDTGSSDFWSRLQIWLSAYRKVYRTRLASRRQLSTAHGAFDSSKSSSFKEVATGFTTSYGDGTFVLGDFITEDVNIGGVAFNQITMGFGTQGGTPEDLAASPYTGIAGVSYITLEDEAQLEGKTYPTILSQMVTQGLIATQAFSLYLDDINDKTGIVLFGGVDSAKYSGPLTALPLQIDPVNGTVDAYYVNFVGIELDGNGGDAVYTATTAGAAALLDSGTSALIIPDHMFETIMNGLQGDINQGTVPCSLVESQGVLKFRFGNANGPVISVPLAELISDIPVGQGRGGAICSIILAPAGDNGIVFGDPFLRGAYVVYNLANNQVAIADANLNATGTSITAITGKDIPGVSSTATGSALPSATGAIVSASSEVGTWDMGKATSTASSGSGSPSHVGAAAGVHIPSSAFVGTVVMGFAVVFGLASGSLMVYL